MVLKWVGYALVVGMLTISPKQGCEDVKRSLTQLQYPEIRDMRQTIALDPQRRDVLNPKLAVSRGPDSLAVPTIGRDVYALDPAPYDVAGAKVANPREPSAAAVARGDSLFKTICWSCHGKGLAGDGPVSAQFMPPPDLLAEATRQRSDGYLYMYMRHGGVVMPSYGNALTPRDTWDLVEYIRHMQKASPR